MGFDIYGLRPTEHVEKPEILNKDFTSLSDKEQDLYVDKHEEYAMKTPGFYFQSDVFHWRPIWGYVCKICDEVMTEDDEDCGYLNIGKEISADTVDNMVSKLLVEMASHNHVEYAKNHALYLESLPLQECEFCNGTGKRDDEFVNKKGECNGCDGEGEHEDFRCNYPFDHKFLEQFVEFLSESGGIKIL